MSDYYNIPEISCNELLNVLPTLMELGLPAFLSGSVGIGKSDTINQFAEMMGCKVVTRMLSQMQACDFMIPFVHNGETKWALADFLANLPDEKCILFLDELNTAPLDVQVVSYQLLLSHSIGGFDLPKETYVVAAGNKITDNALGGSLNTALSDRLVHFNVVSKPDAWINWAMENNVHPWVIAFIKTKPQYLASDLTKDVLVHTSPRSWFRVSQVLKATTNMEALELIVSGIIGTELTGIFSSTLKQLDNLHSVEDYLKASDDKLRGMVPGTITSFYGLIFSFASYAKDSKTITKALITLVKLLDFSKNKGFPKMELKIVSIQVLRKNMESYKCTTEVVKNADFAKYIIPVINTAPSLSDLFK